MRNKLIAAGVNNLKEFGYPECNKENILTDKVYKAFFVSMLKDNKGVRSDIDTVIDALISDLEQTA